MPRTDDVFSVAGGWGDGSEATVAFTLVVVTGRRPFVIGVAGGTGSGKSTVADRLVAAARDVSGVDHVAALRLDAYYRDQRHRTPDERARTNYDHPDAFDWPLLLEHVQTLVAGVGVEAPDYDFAQHLRAETSVSVPGAPIVVIEGILVLYEPALRDLMDLKVFVDTDADVRFIRRLRRDVAERGRTTDSVIEQYLTTVRPSHQQFVEPTKRYADVIVPEGGYNEAALDLLVSQVLRAAVVP